VRPAAPAVPVEAQAVDPESTQLEASHIVDAPLTGLRTVHGAPAAWTDLALQHELARLAPPHGAARLSVAVQHLPTGASASLNGDAAHTPASLYKVGVLGEVLAERAAGRLSLGDRLWLTWDDWYDGAGVLQGRIGEAVSVEELVRLMIGFSDNVAANALMRRVGLENVNQFYAAHGLAKTHLYADDRPDVATADEMAALLAQLVTEQLVDDESTLYMLQYLAQTQPAAWIREALPPDVTVAHKSGQLLGVRNDAAIVYGPSGPYVLVVLAEDLADDTYGETLITRVAETVNDYLARTYPAALFDVR
jgi:beta-lactamase class A